MWVRVEHEGNGCLDIWSEHTNTPTVSNRMPRSARQTRVSEPVVNRGPGDEVTEPVANLRRRVDEGIRDGCSVTLSIRIVRPPPTQVMATYSFEVRPNNLVTFLEFLRNGSKHPLAHGTLPPRPAGRPEAEDAPPAVASSPSKPAAAAAQVPLSPRRRPPPLAGLPSASRPRRKAGRGFLPRALQGPCLVTAWSNGVGQGCSGAPVPRQRRGRLLTPLRLALKRSAQTMITPHFCLGQSPQSRC